MILFNSTNHFNEKIVELLKYFNDLNSESFNPIYSPKRNNKGNSNDSNSNINKLNSGSLNFNGESYFNNQIENSNGNIKLIKDENNNFLIRKNTSEFFTQLEVKEIMNKEKFKLIYITRIFQSFLDLNKNSSHIFNEHSKTVLENSFNYNTEQNINQNNNNKKVKKSLYFKLDSLCVKDTSLQIAICTVLGLFLLQIINKRLTYVLFKFICNKFNLIHNNTYIIHDLKNILDLKMEILLGIYYDLIENLKNSNENFLKKNSKSHNPIKTTNSNNFEDFNSDNCENILKTNNSCERYDNYFKGNSPIKNKINKEKANKNLEDNDENYYVPEKDEIKNKIENCNFKWEEILKALELDKLIFCLSKVSTRNNTIYQAIEQIRNEDRKKLILNTIIKPLDDLYNVFDEALILVQYLFDFINLNNFNDHLLREYTKDYRYFLEVKDVFFHHLNLKSKTNAIYDNLTDRIFFKHKQNYLGNHIYFKLKEKKLEEKIAEHENNFCFNRYFNDNPNDNGIDKKFYNTTSNFRSNKSEKKENIDKKLSLQSLEKSKKKLVDKKEDNLNKFFNLNKSKDRPKTKDGNFPTHFISKKNFFSQLKKNDLKKENLMKMLVEEEKKKELEKKDKNYNLNNINLLNDVNKQKNNRIEVEKEQTAFFKNIKMKAGDSTKNMNQSEKIQLKNQNDNNLALKGNDNNIGFKGKEKLHIFNQENLVKEKEVSTVKIKQEFNNNFQDNEVFINSSAYYNSNNSNFLLTQFPVHENYNPINTAVVNENFTEKEYKLIPKKVYNRTHNYFFQNELYKKKLCKNIENYDEALKNKNQIDEEVSDYLKTIKMNIANKPSTSAENPRDTNINSSNRKVINNIGLLDSSRAKSKLHKTSDNFYSKNPKNNNIKIILSNYQENYSYKSDDRLINKLGTRNSGKKDQMIHNTNEEDSSQIESGEKYRKMAIYQSNNSIKMLNNEEISTFNNIRILSPKINSNYETKVRLLMSKSKNSKKIENFNLFNQTNMNNLNNQKLIHHFAAETNYNNQKSVCNFTSDTNNINNNINNHKLISNFTADTNNYMSNNLHNYNQNNRNNLDKINYLNSFNNNSGNYQYPIKNENKLKLSDKPDSKFRNSSNNFYSSTNKVILDRKAIKSYNPRNITYGIENTNKNEEKNLLSNDGVFGIEKKDDTPIKKTVVNIFLFFYFLIYD